MADKPLGEAGAQLLPASVFEGSPAKANPNRRDVAGGFPLAGADGRAGITERLVVAAPWIIAGGVLVYAFATGGYFASIVLFALIYSIFVIGLNIFMGLAGQASFGHNAFAALSGYTSAVLTTTYSWEPIAACGVGLGLALILALLVGWPILRLKGQYLAMATLAIGLIVYEVAVEWQSVTQGYMGISGIPPLGFAGYEITSDQGKLVFMVIVVGLATLAAARIRDSRFGRALLAVAGSEDAARALGINITRYKLAAFVVSAGYAALAGSLFVHVVEFVSPEVYGLNMVILAFTMLFVGGAGTIGGPVIGAMIISLLPAIFRNLRDYQDMFYGVGLILLLIYAPKGLAGLGAIFSRKGKQ